MSLAKESERSNIGLRRLIARWRRALFGKARVKRDVDEILASGLFDPNWYIEKYPDVAKAGVDPLTHFLSDGAREGRKAGPRFDARWYVENYPDAASSDLNPLLHFIRFGKERIGTLSDLKPRNIEQKADVDLLLTDPHFDAAWYGQVNRIGKTPRHSALHYLLFGSARGLAPSQAFDGDRYLKAYPDVRDAGINPLIHYIRHGESERRSVFAVSDAEQVELSFSFDPKTEANIQAAGRTQSETFVEDETFGVLTLGKSPAGLIARGHISLGLPRRLGLATELFCNISGRSVDTFVGIRNSRRKIPSAANGYSKTDALRGPLDDAWFVSDSRLVLRLSAVQSDKPKDHVLRAFQFRPGGNRTTMIGEARISPQGCLTSLALENPFQPILCVICSREGDVVDGFVIPFPSLSRKGVHAAEAQLLGRGAQHSHRVRDYGRTLTEELLGWFEAKPPVLSAIEVDLTEATGNEAIFMPAARTWLGDMGISISGGNANALDMAVQSYLVTAAKLEPHTVRARNGVLHLPSDGLPSLSAVVSRRMKGGIGSHVVCGTEGLPQPRLFVSLPPMDDTFTALQPLKVGRAYPSLKLLDSSTNRKLGRSGLLAIRLPYKRDVSPAELAMPVDEHSNSSSLEIGSISTSPRERITAVIRVKKKESLGPLLGSLSRQTIAHRLDVILAVDCDVAIEMDVKSIFSGAVTVIMNEPESSVAAALNRAVEAVKTPWMLLLDQHIVLHDRRTLATLRALATYRRVATVSCMRIRQAGFRDGAPLTFHSAGIFPAHVDFAGGAGVIFDTPVTTEAFPRMTYPVAANGLEFALVSRKAWVDSGGLDEATYPSEGHGLAFCRTTMLSGWLHLNTTAISALDTVRRPAERLDIMGADDSPLVEWAATLSRVAVVRRLDG